MSIQSNINATIGAFGARKKAHDLGIAKQAQQRMEEQKQAIAKQRWDIQAYREIIEDEHPIAIISGKDIIDILYKNDITNLERLKEYLSSNFPKDLDF